MQAQVTSLQEEMEVKRQVLAAGPTPMEIAELAAMGSGGRIPTHWGSRQQRRAMAVTTSGSEQIAGGALVSAHSSLRECH
jgi:hypothetical protein